MSCTKDFQITITAATDYLWWKMEEPNGNRTDSIQSKIMAPGLAGTGSMNSAAGKILLGADAQVSLGDVAFLDTTAGSIPYVTGQGWTLLGWFNWAGLNESTTLFGVIGSVGNYWAQAQGPPVNDFLLKSTDPAGNVSVPIPLNGWNFFILEYVPGTGKLQWEINRNGTIGQLAANEPANGTAMDIFLDLFGTTITIPATVDWIWDEIGYFPKTLTDAQKDYIYNGGVGRTSPISLP